MSGVYLGDFGTSEKVPRRFNTFNTSSVPTSLLGTPAVLITKDGSVVTPSGGVTLTVDAGGVTGKNVLTIDMSIDTTTFTAGSDYSAELSAGTVGGTSVVGIVLAQWSVLNRQAVLAPASNVLDKGTCQAGSTSTTIVFRSGSPLTSGIVGHGVVSIDSGTGQGQWQRISAYNAGTQTATVKGWYITPDNTSGYSVTWEDNVNADTQAVLGSSGAAAGHAAMGQAVFVGVVSVDGTPSTTSFTTNPTASPGLVTSPNFYSTPNSLIVFYSGSNLPKTSWCTGYAYSGAVGTFTLGQALPSAPSVGDKFFVISTR